MSFRVKLKSTNLLFLALILSVSMSICAERNNTDEESIDESNKVHKY